MQFNYHGRIFVIFVVYLQTFIVAGPRGDEEDRGGGGPRGAGEGIGGTEDRGAGEGRGGGEGRGARSHGIL